MALQPTTSQGAMNEIRAAYSAGNVEASKQAHTAARAEADIHSGAKSEYVKSMIFGGLDGIITTFAIVAAGAGAELEAGLVIVLGCANLISDGMSMGLGDYFSEQSEEECEDAKRETVLRVVSRMPAESIKVLRDHYVTKKGFLPSDADTMLNRYIKYKGMFADLVVAEQSARLNHQFKLLRDRIAEPAGGAAVGGEEEEEEEEEDGEKIWKQGLLTTLSFWTFGSIPVIAYAIASGLGATKTTTFVVDIIVTIMALAALGVAQAKMSGEARAKKALQMIFNGALACSVGYLIAWFVASFIVDEGALCEGATCRPPFMDQWRFNDAPWLSWETAVPAPDGSDSVNWHCSAHSWNDVTFRNDADHIIHTRVDLFAGENGLYEVAGKAGHSPELTMTVGETYFFDQTHHTNWMHPLGFAYYADGHHGKTWGSAPRATITDFDALEYRINNVEAKRIESRDIMEYNTQAYDSSFSHLKEDWLHKMHGVQLTITEEIANEAAKHGGVIYYYSRFHARTSGKIRIVGEVDGGAYAPTGAELFESAVASSASPFDAQCGTYDTSPYQPALGVCATHGTLLCDAIDTTFETCMAALNCKMKTEMHVGAANAAPLTTFLQQMIPHHANAINMARVLLKTVDLHADPFVEGLMYDIINGQTAQVTGMRARLGQLGQVLPEDVACNNLTSIYAAANMSVPYSINR